VIPRALETMQEATGSRRHLLAGVLSVVVLVVVTLAIALLKSFVPVLSLGVLYVFAVLPIAVAFGLIYAGLVSVASMLAFNWFFLPPVHTFTLSDSRNWFALAVYLVTAVVVSGLATRARRRAVEAEQREVETALLADVATSLMQGQDVAGELGQISARVAAILKADSASIVLGDDVELSATSAPIELVAGEVLNVATGSDISVGDIAELVLALLGKPGSLREHVPERPGQVDRHVGSTDKAKRLLGWEARTPLEQGLERTVAWYRDNEAWWRSIGRTQARVFSS